VEIVPFLKQLGEFGLTPSALILLGVVWQFQKIVNLLDKRLSIVESKIEN